MTLNYAKQHALDQGARSSWLAQAVWRRQPNIADVEQVREIATHAGLFEPQEISAAALAVLGTLQGRNDNRYMFVEINNRLAAFACYGPIPAVIDRHMLHWLIVDPIYQGSGLGKAIVAEIERQMRDEGVDRFYAETSGIDSYAPTCRFYERSGFERIATYPDFYHDGDDKVVYCRKVQR